MGCGNQDNAPAALRLAVNPGIYSGLIAVAQEQGFFREAGLDVQMREPPSGNQCMDGLVKGEVQLATMSEYVFARRMTEAPGLRIAATIATADINEVVARADRGITTPSDLAGRRVGLPAKTAALYYFEAFLLLHGVKAGDVTMVDTPPQKVADALANGGVDAITGWDALVWQARKRFKGEVVSWLAPRQDFHWLLVLRDGPGSLPPETVQRFLAALLQAQDFCREHPTQAKSGIAGKWGLEPEFVDHYWDRLRLSVNLDNSLLEALNQAFQWLGTNASRQEDIPQLQDYILSDPLEALDSHAVTMHDR